MASLVAPPDGPGHWAIDEAADRANVMLLEALTGVS